MDLKVALLQENSKENVNRISNYIGNDEILFAELMEIFFSDKNRMSQRAAWVMSVTAEKKAFLINPYLAKMINLLNIAEKPVIVRNIVRVLQNMDIPEEILGEAFEKCYTLVAHRESPVAIKAFSISILYNVCVKEPELKQEVSALVQMQLPGASSGLKNRCLKVLSDLEDL